MPKSFLKLLAWCPVCTGTSDHKYEEQVQLREPDEHMTQSSIVHELSEGRLRQKFQQVFAM
jgi:hypothetical protein